VRGIVVLMLLVPASLGGCANPAAPSQPAVDLLALSDTAAWVVPDGSCPADPPARSLPAELRIEWPQRAGPGDPNAIMAEIAREVPGGWGGLFYATTPASVSDRTRGPLTMYLVDPERREAAITALGPLLTSAGWGRVVPELPSAQIRQGRWDFAQLHDWYAYLVQNVSRGSDVQYDSSEIAESRNRIEFGVTGEPARQRLTAALNRLDVPCYLVAVAIRPPAVPLR
jgi:hypothetical protein